MEAEQLEKLTRKIFKSWLLARLHIFLIFFVIQSCTPEVLTRFILVNTDTLLKTQ